MNNLPQFPKAESTSDHAGDLGAKWESLQGTSEGTTVASLLVMGEDFAKGPGFRKTMKEMVLGAELELGT